VVELARKPPATQSGHVRAQAEAVAAALLKGNVHVESGKRTLIATRKEVERGWRATSDILLAQGHPELAARVRRFLNEMPPPATDRETIAAALLSSARQRSARAETIQR
jgi:hypothetical protein